jgi:hypothetical protein
MNDIELLLKKNAELESRLGKLEAVHAIRRLHFSYGYYIDYCHYEDVIDLFAEDGEVVFLSGVYKGHASIRRLYVDWIQQLFNQGREGADDGFLFDHIQMQDVITVADDLSTRCGRLVDGERPLSRHPARRLARHSQVSAAGRLAAAHGVRHLRERLPLRERRLEDQAARLRPSMAGGL